MLDRGAFGQLLNDIEHRCVGGDVELASAQIVSATQKTRAVIEDIGVGNEPLFLKARGNRAKNIAGFDNEAAVLIERSVGVKNRDAIDEHAGDAQKSEQNKGQQAIEGLEKAIG